jgi:hypothetical protein
MSVKASHHWKASIQRMGIERSTAEDGYNLLFPQVNDVQPFGIWCKVQLIDSMFFKLTIEQACPDIRSCAHEKMQQL